MLAMLVARPIRVDPSSSSTGWERVGSACAPVDATVAGDRLPVGADMGTVDAGSICMSAFRSGVGPLAAFGDFAGGGWEGTAFRVEVWGREAGEVSLRGRKTI